MGLRAAFTFGVCATGVVTEFSAGLPAGAAPTDITMGPGGALWFTAMTSGVIGRISVEGEITDVAAPGGRPSMITAGPEGAL